MLRLIVVGLALLAVTAGPAGSSATVRPAPAVCVAKLTGASPPVGRADAILLCSQPIGVTATSTGKWSTCSTIPPGADPDCETGSWTARYRSTGALGVNGLTGGGTMTWYGKATGTVTCRRDRQNTGPDVPGTPLAERFHRTGAFPIGQATVAAAARGPLMIVTADGAVTRATSDRAVATCGPYLLGINDPTLGKPVSPSVLIRKGTIRRRVVQRGTVGNVAALVGGPVSGSVIATFAISFRG